AAHKTQSMIHRIMNTMYHDTPDGLEGNEDCGQMSAWYVLSALGFYPVTPGSTDYILGTPLFNTASIKLENHKTFTIHARGVSENNFYIKNAQLEGKPYEKTWLSYNDIIKGGRFDLLMESKPSSYGREYPQTSIKDELIVFSPVISGSNISFRDIKKILISTSQKDVRLFYTTDGTAPTEASAPFVKPIIINKNVIVKAIAIDKKGKKSFVTTAKYYKIDHKWTVQQKTPNEPEYDGGGPDALIDGITSTTDWRKGSWLGYQDNDVDVIIDLKTMTKISKLSARFLQDTRSWIIMPQSLTVEVSGDNKIFTRVYEGKNFLAIEDLNLQVKNIEAVFEPVTTQYVRIIARQYGKLPPWHESAGSSSHLFIDEINIQ
ncbi:MAG TPA: glycoside hydrolase domain-containing protein, partial [Ferruginibacter sp.]|nr:glycoside hydrolase domain-containing protein [Ferruginibacter sp.]